MDDLRRVAITLGYQESLQKNVSNNLKHMWRNTLIPASLHTRKEGGGGRKCLDSAKFISHLDTALFIFEVI